MKGSWKAVPLYVVITERSPTISFGEIVCISIIFIKYLVQIVNFSMYNVHLLGNFFKI